MRRDVRRYAAERGVGEDEALASGMKEKSAEFVELGSSVYLTPEPQAPARQVLPS